MLKKSDIQVGDAKFIRQIMNSYLDKLFDTKWLQTRKELTLIRLDFRFDIVMPAEYRKVLLKLYNKTVIQYGFKKKKGHYATTINLKSKSMSVICYDKEIERIETGNEVQDYEENVLRFEVSLLNPHLNYKKNACGVEKLLESYMTEEHWAKYMIGNILPIFHKGDFFKLYKAEKKINESQLKEKEKKAIRKFLCDISKHGISGINRLISKDSSENEKPMYTPHLIRKYKSYLAELNINPILIPKNEPIALGKESCIRNPFKFYY